MRVLLATLGSAGDFRPVLAIGSRLAARGHEVVLAANARFEPEIRAAGLSWFPLGTRAAYEAAVGDPDVFHPRRGFEAIARRGILPALRPVESWIAANDDGDTVVAATSLCLGARLARERVGVPLATIHLQPAILRSVHDMPVLPGLPLPRRAPAFVKRMAYRLADRVIDGVLADGTNRFRSDLGLPPVRRILDGWMHSPDRVLALFPDWFAPSQPDWPAVVRTVGFVAPEEETALAPEVEAFLAAGDPPLVATAGTAMMYGAPFFAAVVDAARRLGRRAILLTPRRGQVPDPLPDGVLHVGWAPLGALLPRAALLVHHGGVGTCARGLEAGIPQLVMPRSHDQPDNAARLRRLGVGAAIPPARFRARRVAREMERLLGDPDVRRRAEELSRRVDFEASLERACDEIEALRALGLMRRPLSFFRTGDADLPYRARTEGTVFTVRVNDWPDEPTVYSLLEDGREVTDFDDWPQGWARPGS